MRPLFAYLNAAVVADGGLRRDGGLGQGAVAADGSLVERIDRAARELATAMASRRAEAPRDPFIDPVPFDELILHD